MWKKHAKFERHSLWLVLGITIVVSIGGIVEIAPKVMKPTQPRAPEWTWPMVQSV